jgi:hypothetical protein
VWFWPGAAVVLAGVWLVFRGTANRPVDNPDPAPAER